MSGHNQHFKPYTAAQQTVKPPIGCSKCRKPFDVLTWPRSGWTLSSFSPWCPQCHADFASDNFFAYNNRRAKPGPKPGTKHEARGASSFNKAKTHCPAGHEYNEANTYVGKKGRTCRACRVAHVAKAKAKLRGEAV